ncbi:MAG: GNAT family N-acetyltransferase, partial [Anaerolineales bacterium]|nr:GNAT family N-acetyltransferase [Anaerolineales bacterium]
YPAGSQFASLWGGSTIERYRRQGLYTALLAARAQEARGRGVRYLTVDASPMSRPILEKLGFQFIAYSFPCKWQQAS